MHLEASQIIGDWMAFCVGKYRLKVDNRTAGLGHSQTTFCIK